MRALRGQSLSQAGGAPSAGSLVVHVEDNISAGLAGHDGCAYQSPALPLDDALALVRVLTGRVSIDIQDARWSCPIAGGRRTGTLAPAPTGDPSPGLR